MARALDTRAETSRVSRTPDTARLARGPTRPRVRPMKLRRRMRSMPEPAASRPGSAPGRLVEGPGSGHDVGHRRAIGSPGPRHERTIARSGRLSGPFIPASLRERPCQRGSPRLNRRPEPVGARTQARSVGEHGGDLVPDGHELGHHEVPPQPVGAVDHQGVARDERRRRASTARWRPSPARGAVPGGPRASAGRRRPRPRCAAPGDRRACPRAGTGPGPAR